VAPLMQCSEKKCEQLDGLDVAIEMEIGWIYNINE